MRTWQVVLACVRFMKQTRSLYLNEEIYTLHEKIIPVFCRSCFRIAPEQLRRNKIFNSWDTRTCPGYVAGWRTLGHRGEQCGTTTRWDRTQHKTPRAIRPTERESCFGQHLAILHRSIGSVSGWRGLFPAGALSEGTVKRRHWFFPGTSPHTRDDEYDQE